MKAFRGRHFQGEIILWAVRWYCKYGISYRELAEMLFERGVKVDHTTIYRWVQRYAPELEQRLRCYWRRPEIGRSWHIDETYARVAGKWAYLYRAIDQHGHTIDFYLAAKRNANAAKLFLEKALSGLKPWQMPRTLNTDKAPTYAVAIAALKKQGKFPADIQHRQVKYLNNVVECDHGKLKRITSPMLGFKSMKAAYAIIRGVEAMRALRKRHASSWYYGHSLGEIYLVNRAFGF